MKKRGISLIVLIVTIIVIIILAAVVILTLSKNNPIESAREASFKEDVRTFQDELAMYISKDYTSKAGQRDTKISTTDFSKIKEYIPSFSEKYKNKFIIDNDELKYNVVSNEEKKWCDEVNLKVCNIWIQNEDGSISKGETTGIQIGDIVHYETILNQSENAVDNEKISALKSDLSNYSGDSASTDNSSINRDNLTWKVLDVKDGKIRLVSAVPTTKRIKLFGTNGYNNAVYLIDKACSILYSSNKGIAQNLKIEDIEEKIDKNKYDYTQHSNSNVDTGKYGGTKEYISNLHYPNIYSSEIGCKAVSTEDNRGNTLNLSSQLTPVTGYSTASNRLKVTQTYWYYQVVNNDFINEKYYTLFINNGTNLSIYWLSSRTVDCSSSDFAWFSVRRIIDGYVRSRGMFNSTGNNDGDSHAFRPVISLNYDVKISGNSINGWIIQ